MTSKQHMQMHEYHTASQPSPPPYWVPESDVKAAAKYYRNDPYVAPGRVFYFEEAAAPSDVDVQGAAEEQPPAGTCHVALWGRVGFVPYPTEPFEAQPDDVAPEEETVRVFIGQLPYFVTEMQLAWLCHTFGSGHVIEAPERIMKRQANGERLPTGCVHAYTTMRAVEEMARGMHKRMLVDDTGVWHARSTEEFDVLSAYVGAMKKDKTLRVPNRPYDTVVVQLATSTFMPANPMPLSEVPTERGARKAHHHQHLHHTQAPHQREPVVAPGMLPRMPPPTYDAAMSGATAPSGWV